MGGYTKAQLTKDYAIVSNTCVSSPYASLQFSEAKPNAILNEVKQEYKAKDFYCRNTTSRSPLDSTVRSKREPVEASSLQDRHFLYLHPRQYTNIFHILEGTSVILRVMLHPELFPRISYIIIAMQPPQDPDSWTSQFEDLLLEVFPPPRRPSYLRSQRGEHNSLCDGAAVVAKAWETSGTGSFIGEPLGGDLLRAVAYRRAGFRFERKKRGDKLDVLMIKRLGKRKLLNHDEVAEMVRTEFSSDASLNEVTLEGKSGKEQVELFMKVDVLLAAHGAGMTNLIFMVPDSFVFELFPPEWRFACYQRLASNMRLQYRKEMAKGKRGPQCDKNEKSIACLYAGTRDRDFTMEPSVVKEGMREAISKVWSKKYSL